MCRELHNDGKTVVSFTASGSTAYTSGPVNLFTQDCQRKRVVGVLQKRTATPRNSRASVDNMGDYEHYCKVATLMAYGEARTVRKNENSVAFMTEVPETFSCV